MAYTNKDVYFLLQQIQDALESDDMAALDAIRIALPSAIAFVRQKLVLEI